MKNLKNRFEIEHLNTSSCFLWYHRCVAITLSVVQMASFGLYKICQIKFKKLLVITAFLLCYCCIAIAQEKGNTNTTAEQQLENLTATNDVETEDDGYLQNLHYFKKHPLNINEASAEQLASLQLLTDAQIQNFLNYRSLLGKLINVYELQSVPGWDVTTIEKVVAFITVKNNEGIIEGLQKRWRGGDNVFLVRYGRGLEKAKGYDKPTVGSKNYFTGGRDKVFFRYTYNFRNVLQWGLLGDKDAGESLFKGTQKQGFDFYSFHFFARKMGVFKALAIGDFTVNFGQGLIQWQSLAFKKSAAAMAVKRQSAILNPYRSSGEYNFHRGVGVTLQKKRWETTWFTSLKKISANTFMDTVYNETFVTALQTSGYHRTPAENEDRNSITQKVLGGNISYHANKGHFGVNAIHYDFSKLVKKLNEPYNLFALQGASFTNTSIDYSYTYRNLHLFGEAAVDQHFNKALLSGALISLAAKVDACIVYRNIDKAYASINANAFTENNFPVNENGLYAGISVKPVSEFTIDAYADVFQFPWLKYRVDAPSGGKDYFVQATYTPNKQVEVYARYKKETKQINRTGNSDVTTAVDFIPKQNLRLQTNIALSKAVTIRNRMEVLWYNKKGAQTEEGFLLYVDGLYKPMLQSLSGNIRLQYFETNGFNSRIYAYENDLPYSFSIPFFYDKGLRYYVNFNYDASKLINKRGEHKRQMDIYLKWSQSIYDNKKTVGNSLDELPNNKKTDIKCQLNLSW